MGASSWADTKSSCLQNNKRFGLSEDKSPIIHTIAEKLIRIHSVTASSFKAEVSAYKKIIAIMFQYHSPKIFFCLICMKLGAHSVAIIGSIFQAWVSELDNLWRKKRWGNDMNYAVKPESFIEEVALIRTLKTQLRPTEETGFSFSFITAKFGQVVQNDLNCSSSPRR